MNFSYWGSICLAVFVTLWLTDRRRFLNGYFFTASAVCFFIAGWQWLEVTQAPWMQALLVMIKLTFTIITPIALILFALACIIYSRRLVRETGAHLEYRLPEIVGFIILGILVFTLLNLFVFHNSAIWILLGLFYVWMAYFMIGFISYAVASLLDELPVHYSVDFIVILGAGLLPDGTVSKILKKRLDKGISTYRKQRKRGIHPQFVVSGGQGTDEIKPESQAMSNYLIEKGISSTQIIQENKSKSTYENMRNSQVLMVEKKPFYRAIFVTSSFHVFRAGLIAKQLNSTMTGISAPTSMHYLPFAAFREYLALIVMFKGANLVALIVTTVGYLIYCLIIH
ncbi:Integral membrane protein [Pediococcus damnosus]|uniref:Integral membrane protein n=2 Tax=Pediococcus damnosus TaxID=51663 RepID=A0ABN4NA32_9LACO|nr:YdcF family protein [Pediococcus damnosus]AMV67377.1 Integral membrane protein [Pediococcus damnosus]KJU74664.1 membrane protein [Pediococcus damnosus LMG 28219]PIO81401.1 hypothetical protein BSQ38_06920 [Pediococcus damnosus]PJE49077.1 YdcF family protein [Pediococcus damnosus]